MKKLSLTFSLVFAIIVSAFSQSKKTSYAAAFNEQLQMLNGQKPISFKRAVFLTENAYYGNKLNYQSFCADIARIGGQLRSMIDQRGIAKYKTAGNWATFSYMTDTIASNGFKPYTYDFDDFLGAKDWSKQFVNKLLKTHSGNCHSLPFLYKILCEEIGTSAYLALAPNHVYIKHIDEKGQWTNVELTNPGFPRDQWIIKEMAISIEAIKKNIYMKPLTKKESVAFAMFDLASGYKALFGYDDFVLKVTTNALKYFPKCVPLMQYKANCIYFMMEKEKKKVHQDTALLLANIQEHKKLVANINGLGFKDMPIELYNDWVRSVEKEKQKRGFNKSKTQ